MKVKRQRGRPPEFDRDTALSAAISVFWTHGYSATSVDRLAGAMAMSKPSIYAAFGPKEAIYRQALNAFCGQLTDAILALKDSKMSLSDALVELFEKEIDFYCLNDPPLGCLLVCTAPTETINCPEVQRDLATAVTAMDAAFREIITAAGLGATAEQGHHVAATAMGLQGVLHTLAIRTRAGQHPEQLKAFVRLHVPQLL